MNLWYLVLATVAGCYLLKLAGYLVPPRVLDCASLGVAPYYERATPKVYWNKDTTIRTSAAGSNSGTVPPDSNGLSTAQMSNASNYLDWNIPSGGVWAMPAGATHPVLQWQQAQP